MDNEIKQKISIPLSDADLERHLGVKPEEIIKYSELKNYNDITDLLPDEKSFKIILIEDSYNSGHWVGVMRYGKTCEYFNSYGAKWDTDWKFISRMKRLILGQSTNEMTRLMDKAEKEGWNVVWSKHRFQKLNGNIQTCGRWVILRISMMLMGFSLSEFDTFIKKQKKETGGSSDYIVTKYVRS
jgi:hypothetical protein